MSEAADASLQQAVFAKLTSDAGLMAEVGERIYDFVPQTATFPYVRIGDGTSIDWDTVTSNGQEHTVTVHTWSQYLGRKEVKEIMGLIYGVLHHANLSPVGHQAVLIYQEFSEVMQDPDGVTHHGVQRFRVLTEEN